MAARPSSHRPPLDTLTDALEVAAVVAGVLPVLTIAAALLTEVFA